MIPCHIFQVKFNVLFTKILKLDVRETLKLWKINKKYELKYKSFISVTCFDHYIIPYFVLFITELLFKYEENCQELKQDVQNFAC